MPSKKQRRRREKERRHEYEIVLIDETGEEIPVDPAELRAQRREKDGGRAKGNDAKSKKAPARGRGSIREVKPPSWDRVWKRAAFFAVFMFLVLSFIGNKHGTLASKLVPTALYTVLFVPFLYLMDRVQYRQYLRKIGQEPPAPTSRQRPPPGDAGGNSDTGLGASVRRAFRR